MVVFTCNHCGESLQKPKVEKHYQFTCRTVKYLTCVDCFKDFRAEEYVVHTKCVTEEERYAAKGSIPNGIVKKGEVKQESWMEMIKSILDKEKNMLPSHRNLFNAIANYNNVPRKKPKFINFIKSSSGGRAHPKDIEAIWDIIEKYKQETQANKNNEQSVHNINSEDKKTSNGQTNGDEMNNGDKTDEVTNGIDKTKKKKKRKQSECSAEPEAVQSPKKIKTDKKKKSVEETSENGNDNAEVENAQNENSENLQKFSYEEAILNVLRQKPSISLKKLEKKFLKQYTDHFGQIDDLEKLSKKLNKKLKKLENVTINGDKVLYNTA